MLEQNIALLGFLLEPSSRHIINNSKLNKLISLAKSKRTRLIFALKAA